MMKKLLIKINDKSYEVVVEEMDVNDPEPLIAPSKEESFSLEAELIEAPMPGNILKIEVKAGNRVSAGDTIMILEAMKMENEILAPRDGIIKSIEVKEGITVDTGELLAILE